MPKPVDYSRFMNDPIANTLSSFGTQMIADIAAREKTAFTAAMEEKKYQRGRKDKAFDRAADFEEFKAKESFKQSLKGTKGDQLSKEELDYALGILDRTEACAEDDLKCREARVWAIDTLKKGSKLDLSYQFKPQEPEGSGVFSSLIDTAGEALGSLDTYFPLRVYAKYKGISPDTEEQIDDSEEEETSDIKDFFGKTLSIIKPAKEGVYQ